MKIIKNHEAGTSGLKTEKSWRSVVKALTKELQLQEGEYIAEIKVDYSYGLTFTIENK